MIGNKSLLACIVSLTGLVACGDSGGGTASRDSAGVQIVMSSAAGAWTDADRPNFSEVIQIGGTSADTNYQFGAIAAIDVGADGDIYVLDQQAAIVRVFDSTGKFLRRIGRKGTGPGELRTPTALFVTSADTLLVMDMGAPGLVRFGTDGASRGSVDMPMAEGLPVKWVERQDGSVVVQMRVIDLAAMASSLGARRGGAREGAAASTAPQADRLIIRSPSGNVIDTILALPAGQTMQMGGRSGMTMRLFAPEPMWSLSQDGGVFYGVNDEYSINVYDTSGVLKRIVRRKIERKPVTEESRALIKAAMVKAMQEAMSKQGMPASSDMMDRMVGMLQFADYFPALGNLLGGPNGTLWVQQARSAEELTQMASTLETMDLGSSTWDVYNRDGGLLGELQMPDKFVPLRWLGDKLAGLQSDANGTSRVLILKVTGLCSNVEVPGKACI